MNLIKCGVYSLIVGLLVVYFLRPDEYVVPKLPNTWWGPGKENQTVDNSVRSFKVAFDNKDIEDLKFRLKNTRLPKPGLEGAAWTYGVPGQYLPTIIDYWLNKYDFKKREVYMNKYPHFITNIQGLDIHFLHVKPKDTKGKKVLPLLMAHGWPASAMEFYKVIPRLTNPTPEFDFVFEIIVPSLPGFGFSSPAVKPGLGATEMGVILKNLMERLGFEKYYTHGGDWGAGITASMSAMYPEHILGTHSSMCLLLTPKHFFKVLFFSFFPALIMPREDIHLTYPLSEHWAFKMEESGYFHIQATKPDTVGVAQSDSPIGMAAYILEKFSTLTNPDYKFKDDGALFEKFTPEELIDNLMWYWIPNTMTTAMRIYAETFNKDILKSNAYLGSINVPSACLQFRHEIIYLPPYLLKDRYQNLVSSTKFLNGGHFAAIENPALLAGDIWHSVMTFENIRHKREI